MDTSSSSESEYVHCLEKGISVDERRLAKSVYNSSEYVGQITFQQYLEDKWLKDPSEESKDVTLSNPIVKEEAKNIACHGEDDPRGGSETPSKQKKRRPKHVMNNEVKSPLDTHKAQLPDSIPVLEPIASVKKAITDDIPVLESKYRAPPSNKIRITGNLDNIPVLRLAERRVEENIPVIDSRKTASEYTRSSTSRNVRANLNLDFSNAPIISMPSEKEVTIGASGNAQSSEKVVGPKRNSVASGLFDLASLMSDRNSMEVVEKGGQLAMHMLSNGSMASQERRSELVEVCCATILQIGAICSDSVVTEAKKSLQRVIESISSEAKTDVAQSFRKSEFSFFSKDQNKMMAKLADDMTAYIGVVDTWSTAASSVRDYAGSEGTKLGEELAKKCKITGKVPTSGFGDKQARTLVAIINLLLGVCQAVSQGRRWATFVLERLNAVSARLAPPSYCPTKGDAPAKKKSLWDRFLRQDVNQSPQGKFTLGLCCAANVLLREENKKGTISSTEKRTISLFIPDRRHLRAELAADMAKDKDTMLQVAKHHTFMGSFLDSPTGKLQSFAGSQYTHDTFRNKIRSCNNPVTAGIVKKGQTITSFLPNVQFQVYYIDDILC